MTSRSASDDGEIGASKAEQAPAAAGASHAVQELRELPVQLIDPNPSQPRQHFDETALQALAGSIRERGILQPLLVRPRPRGRYQIVAGERRWYAAQIAGLEKIPALVCQYNQKAAGLDERAPAPRRSRRGRRQEQYLDEASRAVARAWGDLVGLEVSVRPMAYGRLRLEVQFNSPEAALDAAGRLAEAVSGSNDGESR
jgi:hypothetical protein